MSSLQMSLEDYARSMRILDIGNAQANQFKKSSVMQGLQEDQRRIHEAGLQQMSMNEHSSTNNRTIAGSSCQQSSEESDDKSPVAPRKVVMRRYDLEEELEAPSSDSESEECVGEPKCLECETIYRDNNNSVPHLLAMCLGLTDSLTEDIDRMLIADLEGSPVYRDHLEKSLHPKVPLLKEEVKRE
jgi:hypothetical protein